MVKKKSKPIKEAPKEAPQEEPKKEAPKEEPKKVPDIDLNNNLEDIRQIRRDAENLRTLRELPTKVNFEIRKQEPYGLHETFTKDKLLEGSILIQIKEDNEKI